MMNRKRFMQYVLLQLVFTALFFGVALKAARLVEHRPLVLFIVVMLIALFFSILEDRTMKRLGFDSSDAD